jgi:hypothetical protein
MEERDMKKICALTIAALLATSGAALAKSKATTISLDGYCDVLSIQNNKVLKTALTATDDPNCEALFGAGFAGKIKKIGNSAILGMHISGTAEEFVFRIDYPFVTGGSWVLYGTQDGVNLTAFAGNTYTVNGTPERGSRPVLSAIRH